ncbi:transposase [Chromobacterium sp. IIBBL 290-4]|uniref:transposase n=1 Tax=Chromobacterium sp. IIBBL 290-4 TaxID=2953890 RepID=UPI0020B87DEC|nr:transposase [Chromobacterium sp. IIBBL 290-4]UTH74477.1 transposase [Chromobacterium sp. IIBBL 290-4]
MTELDDKLSEWVGVARKVGSVIVDRYDSPWVCIVDYPTWNEINNLRSYIPDPSHALVMLRERIDEALDAEADALSGLSERCASRVAAAFVIRAWVLQIVYSIGCPKIVRQALIYNMLWRWFVGYAAASAPLPDAEAFIRDMRLVSADARVVKAVYCCLSSHVSTHVEACEFSVNFGLLHALRDHCAPALPPDHRDAALQEAEERELSVPA